MKMEVSLALALAGLLSTGCQPSARGTAGANTYQTGMAEADGSTFSAFGRVGPFEESGIPDVNIAASRAQAGLDVSGAGMAELSRRSETATWAGPTPNRQPRPALVEPKTDAALLQRVRLALASLAAAPAQSPVPVQMLNMIRLNVDQGVVTLQGPVGTADEKIQIGDLIQSIPGVKAVRNGLEVTPPAAAPLSK